MRTTRCLIATLLASAVVLLAARTSTAQSPDRPGNEAEAAAPASGPMTATGFPQDSEARQRRVDRLERRLEELMQAAEEARQSGDLEVADRLQRRVEALMQEREQIARGEDELRITEARQKLREIQEELARATERRDEEAVAALQFEMQEVEDWIDSVQRERERNHRVQKAEQQIDSLLRRAEIAERQGREEEARSLHHQADQLAADLEQMRARDQEKEIAALTARLQAHKREAEIAAQRGDRERAGMLRAQADEMQQQIAHLRREQVQHGERMALERRMRDLLARAEEREAAGRVEEADRARAQAEQVARKIEQWEREAEASRLEEIETELVDLRDRHDAMMQAGHLDEAREVARVIAELEERLAVERRAREERWGGDAGSAEHEHARARIEELRAAAAAAAAAGRREEADELRLQAEMLAQQVERSKPRRDRGGDSAGSIEERLVREIRALREEIRALRAEVERLRNARRAPDFRRDAPPIESPI